MPVDVDFCLIGRETRVLPTQVKCKSVPSLISLCVFGEKIDDLSEVSGLQNGDPIGPGTSPWVSKNRFLAHSGRPNSFYSYLPVNYRRSDDLQSTYDTATTTSYDKPHGIVSNRSSQSPFHSIEKLAPLAEQESTSPVRTKRLVRAGSTSSSSISISTHSPSPVKAKIVSPYAVGTIGPPQNPAEHDQNSVRPNERYIPPNGQSVSSNYPNVHPKTELPEGDKHPRAPPALTHYPDNLNPFDSESSDQESESEELPSCVKVTSVSTNPFDNDVETPSNPFACSDFATQVRLIRPQKKPAPLPPNYSDRTFQPKIVANGHSSGFHSPESFSTKSELSSQQSLHRHSTLGYRTTDFGSNTDSHIVETRSMIVKRPAPPLPVHDKRIIKTDPSDTFVDYQELHESLYVITQKINTLEQQARSLQQEIKFAKRKRARIDKLLEKWTHVVEVRDALSKKQTQLVERLRRQELDERHANLEYEFRLLWAKQTNLKTPEEKEREKQLLEELIETVDQRAELVDREEDEAEDPTENTRSSRNERAHRLCVSTLKRFRKSIRRRRTLSMLSFRR